MALGGVAPAAGMFMSPSERVLWRERLGRLSRPGGCDAWVHAASLGEVVAATPLVRELLRRQPDARLQVTATTRSGRERLAMVDPPAAPPPPHTPQAVPRF